MNLLSLIPGAGIVRDIVIGALAAAAAGAAVMTWAVLIYGPRQYDAGGAQMALTLDAASKKAQEELSNEAEKSRFRLADCRARGAQWLYDFSTGECRQRPAN